MVGVGHFYQRPWSSASSRLFICYACVNPLYVPEYSQHQPSSDLSMSWRRSSRGSPLGIREVKCGGMWRGEEWGEVGKPLPRPGKGEVWWGGCGEGVGDTPSSALRGLRDSRDPGSLLINTKAIFLFIVLLHFCLAFFLPFGEQHKLSKTFKTFLSCLVPGLPRPSSEGVLDPLWSRGVCRSLWGVTDLGGEVWPSAQLFSQSNYTSFFFFLFKTWHYFHLVEWGEARGTFW